MLEYNIMVHLGAISVALILGAFIRHKVTTFSRFLIPAPIIAGFFLLFFYNFIAPKFGLTQDFLGDLVYHMLNISFIAMMLRTKDGDFENKKNGNVFANVFTTVNQYGLQVFFGLLVVLILMYTISPNLFPAFGFLLALGFELGPGQAYSISNGWIAMGFEGASSVALTIAAAGFLVGAIGGVIIVNWGIAKGYVDNPVNNKEIDERKHDGLIEYFNLDSLTFHFAVVIGTYLLSLILLTVLTYLLAFLGPIGVQFGDSLWGLNFIFSSLIAILVRRYVKFVGIGSSIEESMCNRISGISIDLTISASLGAISLTAISNYLFEIFIMIVLGIFIATKLLPLYCKNVFSDNWFKRMLILFGCATGTLPTGLALLRIVEPKMDSQVATDYMYSAAIVFPIMIPLILCANLPALAATTNNMMYFYTALIVAFVYLVASLIYLFFRKKRIKSLKA
ncbi:MAG: sodium/glutamate symporter [Pleomorphochaeta sp.]